MNEYLVDVTVKVQVLAFSQQDAAEAVEDVFGTGDACGLNVVGFEINDTAEL